MANFIITRVGSVGTSGTLHFMRDHDGDRTACGKSANQTDDCLKSYALHHVRCGSCWRVQRASLPRV